MKKIFALLTLLLCLCAQTAFAKTYKVALANIPPYAFNDENNNANGILVDVTRDAFQRLGHQVTFNFYPWARSIQNVKTGRVDAITPFFHSDERAEYTHFVGKGVLTMELQFFKSVTEDFKVSTLEQAAAYRIAKVSKASMGERFSAYEKAGKLKVDYVPNTLTGLKVMLAGRTDLFASVRTIALYAANSAGFAKAVGPAGKPFDQRQAYLAFSRKTMDQETCDLLVNEIELMRKAGRIDEIIKKYVN
ncbi:substrate-binding periplasmic protein [Candidatus Terasakiella magnetica]|nr:transporter substrate-binding domain-containing protein [Candidatus Terasakiella magnetica]